MKKTNPYILLFLILLFTTFSCVNIPKEELKYSIDNIPKLKSKIPIHYDCKDSELSLEINHILKKCGSFDINKIINSYPFIRKHNSIFETEFVPVKNPSILYNDSNTLLLKFNYQNEHVGPHLAFLIPNTLVTVLTIGLIPAYSKDTHFLTVDLLIGDKFIKRYDYSRTITHWLHLIYIFQSDVFSIETIIFKDLLLNFLTDFINDYEKIQKTK